MQNDVLGGTSAALRMFNLTLLYTNSYGYRSNFPRPVYITVKETDLHSACDSSDTVPQ